MFGIDDIIEGAGLAIGAIAVGAVAIVGGPRAKPYAKRAMKGYLVLSQRAREAAAEGAERVMDLYAEAKQEFQSEQDGEPAPRARRASRSDGGSSTRTRRRSSGSTSRATRSTSRRTTRKSEGAEAANEAA